MTSKHLSENGFRVDVAEKLGGITVELKEHNRRIGNVEVVMADNAKKLDQLIVSVDSSKAVSKTRVRDIGLGATAVVGLAALMQIIINLHDVLLVFGFK